MDYATMTGSDPSAERKDVQQNPPAATPAAGRDVPSHIIPAELPHPTTSGPVSRGTRYMHHFEVELVSDGKRLWGVLSEEGKKVLAEIEGEKNADQDRIAAHRSSAGGAAAPGSVSSGTDSVNDPTNQRNVQGIEPGAVSVGADPSNPANPGMQVPGNASSASGGSGGSGRPFMPKANEPDYRSQNNIDPVTGAVQYPNPANAPPGAPGKPTNDPAIDGGVIDGGIQDGQPKAFMPPEDNLALNHNPAGTGNAGVDDPSKAGIGDQKQAGAVA